MADYPSPRSFYPPEEFSNLREQTLSQIEKDFALQGIRIRISREIPEYEKLVRSLGEILRKENVLETDDLQPLLYQLDIAESFADEVIVNGSEEGKVLRLADAIIKRCFAKVVYRQRFS